MKTRGAAVRFVLVSATVPNIQDVATWIGTNGSISKPATVLEESQTWYDVSLCLSGTSLVKSIGPVNSPESWSGSTAQKDRTILCFPKSWTASYLQRFRRTRWESLFWSFAQQEMVIYDREIFSPCLKFCKRCIRNGRAIEKRLRYGGKQKRKVALVKASTVTKNFLVTVHLNRPLDRRSVFTTRGPVVSPKSEIKMFAYSISDQN